MPVDYAAARHWLEKAAAAGDGKAPRYIGLMYENGWRIPVDYQQVAHLYQQGAERGDSTSQSITLAICMSREWE